MRFWKNNRVDYRPARRIEKSHIWYRTCVPELRVLANRTMIVASLAFAFTWLLDVLARFRRSDERRMALVKSRKKKQKKQAGGRESKKKSSMSITKWRLYFHYKCDRPQLVDLQLITFFFFILRLHNRRKFSHTCFSHNGFFNNWECYILAP